MLMKTFASLLLLIAVTAAGAGSAWAQQVVKPAVLTKIHSIGVIVALGDTAEIKTVGVTVFGNKVSQLAIADWKLNDLALTEVRAALGGQFQVSPAPLDPKTAADIAEDVSADKRVSVPAIVRGLNPRTDDAYLVLLACDRDLPFTNQTIHGLGVVHHDSLIGGHDPAIVHVLYLAALLDGRTARLLGWALSDAPVTEAQADGLHFPHANTDVVDWSGKSVNLTPAQQNALKDQMAALLTKSIPYTLETMGLIQSASIDTGQ